MEVLWICVVLVIFDKYQYTESSVCGLPANSSPEGWTTRETIEGTTKVFTSYTLLQTEGSTYSEAEALCAAQDGVLVNNFDMSLIWWIGSNLPFSGNVWIGVRHNGVGWVWPDGTTVSTANWAPDEPDPTEEGAVVVIDTAGNWYSVDDTTVESNIICQRPAVCKLSQINPDMRGYSTSQIEEIHEKGTMVVLPCNDGVMTFSGAMSVTFTCGENTNTAKCRPCNVIVTCDIPADFWSSNSLITPETVPEPFTYGQPFTVSCSEGNANEDCSSKQDIECLADRSIGVIPCTPSGARCCFLDTLNFWQLGISWPSVWTLRKGDHMELTCSGSNYLPECTTSQYIVCHDVNGDDEDDDDTVPQLSQPVRCTCRQCR